MRIGSYDPRGLPQFTTDILRPPAEKPMKGDKPAPGGDEVRISEAARNMAANGADGTDKPKSETAKSDKTVRVEKRQESGFYDRPEIKKEIARRIIDEILKKSSGEK